MASSLFICQLVESSGQAGHTPYSAACWLYTLTEQPQPKRGLGETQPRLHRIHIALVWISSMS